MSKKKNKKSKAERKAEREEQYRLEQERAYAEEREKLDKMGVPKEWNGIDVDIIMFIQEIAEEIDYKPIGFESDSASYNAYDSRHEEDEQAHLGLYKYNDYYVVYKFGEFCEGYSFDEWESFDNKAEAEKYYNGWKAQKTISQILDEFKGFSPEGMHATVWYRFQGYAFNLLVGDIMIAERLRDLIEDECLRIYNDFVDFRKKLEEKSISITECYKLPREWNNNQRYYYIGYRDGNGRFQNIKLHIPSKMQHKPREIFSMVTVEDFLAPDDSSNGHVSTYYPKCEDCGRELRKGVSCFPKIMIKGVKYDRIPFGSETRDDFGDTEFCPDCNCGKGQYHHYHCDIEEHPVNHSQLLMQVFGWNDGHGRKK